MRVSNLEGKIQSRKARISNARGFPSLRHFDGAKRMLCAGLAYVLCFAALSCVLLFVGCQESAKSSQPAKPAVPATPRDTSVARMPNGRISPKADKVDKSTVEAEKKKAQLLKELDYQFENPDAHYELGRLYQADGLWAQAEYHYKVALGFKPSHKDAQAALVKVMIDSGNQGKASNYSEVFMNQAAGSAAESFNLAEAFKRQGLEEHALSCYLQALNLAPNSFKVNRQIGYYYLSKGDKERARSYLSRSFELNSNQPEVAGELGRLGVEVKIPKSTVKYTQDLDKTVEPAGKEVKK